MSTKRIPYEPGHVYFITANTWKRQSIFTDDLCVRLLLADLDFYRRKFDYRIWYWVVMPEHLHWVMRPSPQDFRRFEKEQIENERRYADDPARFYLSAIIQNIKSHSAQVINAQLNRHGTLVWQHGFDDQLVQDNDMLRGVAEYTHANPVVAELVTHPEEYPYSSYREAMLGRPGLLQLDPVPW